MRALFLFFLFFGLTAHAATPFDREWKDTAWKKTAGALAVQSGGRVKPLDTFAREGMELLTGKAKFRGKDSIELLFSLVFEPQLW